MSDNKVLSAAVGVGPTVATDEIAGVDYQRVKVNFGADGSSTDASSANPFPVLHVGALPAGTNAIGKLAANSGVDIGDVDVTSSALPTGASTAAKQPALGTAGAASADVLTVQGIASMTPFKVDGSAVTQPVSGPLTDAQLRASVVPVDTELPAAAALADGASNPTAPATGSFGMIWNGATWDRMPGTAALGASMNFTKIAGTTVDTNSGNKSAGTQRVVLATDQPALSTAMPVSLATLPALVAGTAAIGKLAANSGVDIGDVDVTSISAGTNAIGNVGVIPRTTGGLTTYHLVSAATTNATNIKASAGQLFGWYIYNSNTSARKVAFHNSASAPTAGASIFFAIVIPPSSAANVFLETGIAFSSGIGITTVTDLTDAGATAVAANDLIINLFYA